MTSKHAMRCCKMTSAGAHVLPVASSVHTNALRSCEHVTIAFVTGCQSMAEMTKSCCSARADGGR